MSPGLLALVTAIALAAAAVNRGDANPARRHLGVPCADTARRLDALRDGRAGAALPPGWTVRGVRGAREVSSSLVPEAGVGLALRVDAPNAASWLGIELPCQLRPAAGTLTWRWRVDAAPQRARLQTPALDDSPARVIVVFGRPSLLARPRVLFYTWGRDEPLETTFTSRVSGRLAIVTVRGARDPLGRWLTESRDLAADYARAFGGTAPPVHAVGLMVDTEQTGDRAVTWLGEVRWVPTAGAP